MKDYGHYVHKRALCHALSNVPEHQSVIIDTLMADAAAGLLDSLSIDAVTGSNQLNITFKYRSDTTAQTLAPEDYLVSYLDGTRMAFTPVEFDASYKVYDGAFADCAITDQTHLSM